jgi:hypothetical protein
LLADLANGQSQPLEEFIAEQPPWFDLPVILSRGKGWNPQ